jgi:hypothetical protein
MTSQKNALLCQSCGMPMAAPEQFGTNADGSVNREYCCYCFQKGDFTVKTGFDAFVDMQVKIAVDKLGMREAQARAMAEKVLPALKRWRA